MPSACHVNSNEVAEFLTLLRPGTCGTRKMEFTNSDPSQLLSELSHPGPVDGGFDLVLDIPEAKCMLFVRARDAVSVMGCLASRLGDVLEPMYVMLSFPPTEGCPPSVEVDNAIVHLIGLYMYPNPFVSDTSVIEGLRKTVLQSMFVIRNDRPGILAHVENWARLFQVAEFFGMTTFRTDLVNQLEALAMQPDYPIQLSAAAALDKLGEMKSAHRIRDHWQGKRLTEVVGGWSYEHYQRRALSMFGLVQSKRKRRLTEVEKLKRA